MKAKKLLMMASGAAIIALVTFGSPAKAVDILQTQEIKIGLTTSLPHLVATTIQSTDVSHVKFTVSEQKNKQLGNQILTVIKNALKDGATPASILLGIYSFIGNEKWKRRQYVEEKVKDFESQLETINVKKMLNTELQCIELFPFLKEPMKRFVVVEDEFWAEALLDCRCNNTSRELKDAHQSKESEDFFTKGVVQKAAIRDDFNKFLNHLQQFEKMIESKAVKESDLKNYLNPWIVFIDRVNDKNLEVDNEFKARYPVLKSECTPKQVLLEYMGLKKCDPSIDFSAVQKDVGVLFRRYCQLNQDESLVELPTSATKSGRNPARMRQIPQELETRSQC